MTRQEVWGRQAAKFLAPRMPSSQAAAWETTCHDGHLGPMSTVVDPLLVAGIRRTVDVTLATAGLIVAAPAVAFAALCVASRSRGPVFVEQTCLGRGGRPFPRYRLRTTAHTADDSSRDLQNGTACLFSDHGDEEPISHHAVRGMAWIERTGLGRVPQLLNVIVGDMALVGPRAESIRWWETVSRATDRPLLAVRPGLTSTGTLYHVGHCQALLNGGPSDAFVRSRFTPVRVAVDRVGLARRGMLYDGAVFLRTFTTAVAKLAGRRTFPELPEMPAARALLRSEGRVIAAGRLPEATQHAGAVIQAA